MTPEEAKKYLDNYVGDGSMKFVITPIRTEALISAIKSLEKQVPKNIEHVYDGDADDSLVLVYRCPVCEEELYRCNYYAYCPYCGQAIDWEEE